MVIGTDGMFGVEYAVMGGVSMWVLSPFPLKPNRGGSLPEFSSTEGSSEVQCPSGGVGVLLSALLGGYDGLFAAWLLALWWPFCEGYDDRLSSLAVTADAGNRDAGDFEHVPRETVCNIGSEYALVPRISSVDPVGIDATEVELDGMLEIP